MSQQKAERIRALNDALRKSPTDRSLGKVYLTDGVNSSGPEFVARALAAVAAFDAFDDGNDPWREHDFGAVVVDGTRLFFKVDYFDRRDPDLGSEDPSNPAITERAMTIMLAEEY